MKVLIACEFSGIVREAFRKRGHDAWSCDLLPTEIPGQPCTYLSYAAFTDYIEFLASRYCPIGADNDPQGLNKNWVKNVKYFLTKKEG